MKTQKTLRTLLIATLTLALPMATAWAKNKPTSVEGGDHTGAGNGGNQVEVDGKKVIADPFYDIQIEPYFMPDDVRKEIIALLDLTENIGIKFDGSFWDCDVLSDCSPIVDYRQVEELPVKIVMKMRKSAKIKNLKPYGYTEYGSRKTILDKKAFDEIEDITDKALALIHERLIARFEILSGPEGYDFLTRYISGLRMLRRVERQLDPYTQKTHDYLLGNFIYGYDMITGKNMSRANYRYFLVGGEGSVLLSEKPMSSSGSQFFKIAVHRNIEVESYSLIWIASDKTSGIQIARSFLPSCEPHWAIKNPTEGNGGSDTGYEGNFDFEGFRCRYQYPTNKETRYTCKLAQIESPDFCAR